MKVIKVISKKEFNKLSKDNYLNIVGFSRLEKYKNKHKDSKKFRGMHYINGKDYVVEDNIEGITYKYADLGDNNYIAIKRNLLFILVPLMILLIIGFISILSIRKNNYNKITLEDGLEIDLDKQPMIDGKEAIKIPGTKSYYLITEEQPEINLINPENNTVYFKYTIIVDNEVIHSTNWIEPNKMVKVNLWELLDEGTYNAEFHIDTLDCIKETPCTSSNLVAKISIEK